MARGFKTGGRRAGTPNKATAEVKKYAQQYDTRMIDVLTQIAENPGADEKARVMAAKEVLDRGHGKSPQAITGPDGEALPPVPTTITFVIKKADGADCRD